MEAVQPFCPSYGAGQSVAVGVVATTIKVDAFAPNLRITNQDPTVAVFVRVTESRRNPATDPGVAAVVNQDLLVLPNTSVVISKGNNHGNVSIIGAAATTKPTYVQPGIGLWGN